MFHQVLWVLCVKIASDLRGSHRKEASSHQSVSCDGEKAGLDGLRRARARDNKGIRTGEITYVGCVYGYNPAAAWSLLCLRRLRRRGLQRIKLASTSSHVVRKAAGVGSSAQQMWLGRMQMHGYASIKDASCRITTSDECRAHKRKMGEMAEKPAHLERREKQRQRTRRDRKGRRIYRRT